jgi:hypothetical protein
LKGPTGLDLLIHPGDERGNVAIDVQDRRIRELMCCRWRCSRKR